MQAQDKPTRKYALTKIAAGDYVFPSNDARALWRVSRYIDGPTQGLDIPKDREFWGVWRWDDRVTVLDDDGYIDVGEWDHWEMCSAFHESRAEAITAALTTD